MEYEPAQCFKTFYEKAYKLRVEATRNQNKPLANVTKITMNSSYGRMIMNPMHFTKTRLASDVKPQSKHLVKSFEHISDDLIIIDSKQSKTTEKYPLHIGKPLIYNM